LENDFLYTAGKKFRIVAPVTRDNFPMLAQKAASGRPSQSQVTPSVIATPSFTVASMSSSAPAGPSGPASSSSAAAPAAVDESRPLTFEASPFWAAYSALSGPPTRASELLVALDGLLEAADVKGWETFSRRLQEEAFQSSTDFVSAANLPNAAERLWTSALQSEDMEEFCGVLNRCCRYTWPTIEKDTIRAKHAAVLARAINTNLVSCRKPGTEYPFPPNGQCFRGGGLPDRVRDWFRVGRVYRVPNFLATSWDPTKCGTFMERACDVGVPPVLWTIQLDKRGDPKGENLQQYQVKNVNYVNKEAKSVEGAQEGEFLFAAYSVFQVTKVEMSDHPTPLNPHKIWLDTFDSRNYPKKDLELALWS